MVREEAQSLPKNTALQKSKKPFPVHILVFLAPAVIIYTLFMIIPLLGSLGLGFFTQNESGTVVFAGLDNYIRLLTDPLWSPRVWGALRNNVIFFVVHMCVQNPIGLFLAALISSQLISHRAATIYRSLIFTPTVLSVVLVGFIWRLLLSPVWGVADDLLAAIGIQSQPWLGLETTALPVLSLISVWQWVGIPMMLFLAALMGIPDEIVEAARVDGATAWSVFWRIKFPLILPTVGIVGVLTFVGNFNAFDLIYTTQTALAGPNFSTDILGTLFYRTFFGFQLQLGNDYLGAAVAGIMFVIIATGVLFYLFGWQRRILKMDIQL